MLESLDLAAVVTSVSATVTATAAVYTASRVRRGVGEVLSTIEQNERRSRRNERLLLGGKAYQGIVEQVTGSTARTQEMEDSDA